MSIQLNLIDLGDARKETKQLIAFPLLADSAFSGGLGLLPG